MFIHNIELKNRFNRKRELRLAARISCGLLWSLVVVIVHKVGNVYDPSFLSISIAHKHTCLYCQQKYISNQLICLSHLNPCCIKNHPTWAASG